MRSLMIFWAAVCFAATIQAQNTWAETHSIVNPVALNNIKIDKLTAQSVLKLFGKPDNINKAWSEYDDQNLLYYKYKNSTFEFWESKKLRSFRIQDKMIKNVFVSINGHSVGDAFANLQRDYYKSTVNMKDNEVFIHLVTADYRISSTVVIFTIKENAIASMRMVDLD